MQLPGAHVKRWKEVKIRQHPEWWLPCLYLLISALWIYESDSLVAAVSASIEHGRLLSTYKGMGFILTTAILIHVGLKWALRRERANARRVQEAHAFNEQIVRSAEEGIIVYGPDLRVLVWNPFMERLTGLSAPSVLGRHPMEIYPSLEPSGLVQRLEQALQGTAASPLEFRHPSPPQETWISDTSAPLRNANGEIVGVIGIVRDITERKASEQELRISQQRFHKLFHSAPMLMALSRLEDGRFLEVNDQFCRITGFGREEVLGRTSTEIGYVSPDERARLLQAIGAEGRVTNFELVATAKSGRTIMWLLSGEILEIGGERVLLSMATDITEIKQLEENRRSLEAQLNHLQRLETVGRLASGVSHDMNNVLAAIMGVASVMQAKHSQDPGIAREVAILLRAAGRGKDLVASLRDFTRKELGTQEELDLNALVQQETAILERTTLQKVTLSTRLEPELPRIQGDASLIGNALMNLCVNACDAMPHGGTILITTRTLGQGFVEVSVQDEGEGMPPEVLARASEPFFTTKPAGKGTGLGLSQVQAAVKAHGGTLDIQSQAGRGTRIALAFPMAPDPGARGPRDPGAACPGAVRPALRILLVDDDELARIGTASLLKHSGHQVEALASGPRALEHLRTGAGADLVILDLNMPGLDGSGTLDQIRLSRPGLPVLLATGFPDERIPALLRQHPDVRVLPKPFSLQELQHALSGLV